MKNWYTGLVMCLILGVGTQMKAQEEATYKILYDARTFKIGWISNNGEWLVSGDQGFIFTYNTVTGKSKTILEADKTGMNVRAVSNSGMLLGSYGIGTTAPAAYYKDNKWTLLPVPRDRLNWDSMVTSVSEDETILGGYVDGNIANGDCIIPCLWKLVGNKYEFEALPQPDKDMNDWLPQGACVRAMSADGSVLVGDFWARFDSKRLPISWVRGENGEYTYKVWGEELIYNLDAVKPGIHPDYEDYVTAEQGTPEYEEQYDAWYKLLYEYNNKKSAFCDGKGYFELRNVAVSRNGRWMVVGWYERGNPKELQAYRIDLINNTSVTLEGNRNTCPRAVLDDGTVIAFSGFNEAIWTGQVYKDEQSGQIPLYEWVKEEMGVDISEDFLYTIPIIDYETGETVSEADSIVTGCCTISKDGTTVLGYLAEPDNYSHIINYFVRKQSADNISSQLLQDVMIYASENILYIKGEAEELFLFDITGKDVYHVNVVQSPMSLNFLRKGIYLARLRTSSGDIVTNKIMIK